MLKFFSLYCNSLVWYYLYIRNIPDSSTPSDDNNLEISGYTLVRLDHPSNNKRWCLYLLQRFSTWKILDVQYLQEIFVLNLKLMTKLVTIYLSTDLQAKVKMTLKLRNFYWNPWIKFRKFASKESFLSCGNWRLLCWIMQLVLLRQNYLWKRCNWKFNIPVWTAPGD